MSEQSNDSKACVFCEKIKNEKLQYVYPAVVMFEPLNPVTKGHRLFVPTEHVVDMADNLSVTARVMREAAKYVREQGIEANVITSRGINATQSVFHLHVHVVPRIKDDGLALPWTNQRTDMVAEGSETPPQPSEPPSTPTSTDTKMEQILETFGDRVADKFGGSWDDLSPKAQVELYGEFYDSLLDIFSKALNEARVNAKIEILAHVLVHQATGRKHIGLSRPGVVSVLADLQAERQEIWESKPKKDIEG